MRTVLVLMLPLLLWHCGTIIFLFNGGFQPRRVYTIPSPDGRLSVTLTQRVAFPANELFDPALVVTIELHEVSSGRVLQGQRVDLLEASDLEEPEVEWTAAGVRVSGFDNRQERLLFFNHEDQTQ